LDADNIPLGDPSSLFSTAEYNATGALLWPDFWGNTVAPQAAEMLGVPRSEWPGGSFESGQMVIDKARHWRGLVAAAWLNAYAPFWCARALCVCFFSGGGRVLCVWCVRFYRRVCALDT
jgi:alpha 1,2-mannosyltransferase